MKELEKLRDAWGIDKDAVEGQAFDRELQVWLRFGLRLPLMSLKLQLLS